jgi:hypothetical protein
MPDLVMFKGYDKTYLVTVLDRDGGPLNITGATITCQGRRSADDADPVWTATCEEYDFENGQFTIAISPEAVDSGKWDAFITGVDNAIDPSAPALAGSWSITNANTHP